jgi:hypothetical protein
VLLARNAMFRDKHRGKRCFVIGTGRSLRTQNLAPLSNEITFVVNEFCQHPLVGAWQPTYYSLIDPGLFDLEEPSNVVFFRELRQRVWNSTFFVPIYYHGPLDTRGLIEREGILGSASVFYVALDQPHSRERSFEVDLTGFVHSVWNVVQLNILVALFMGCSPIVLLGLDHDWLASRSETNHFYTKDILRWTLNRRPPQYQDRSYRALMERQLQLWHHYETLAMIAAQRGITIMNATAGGFLDVYPRVDFETLFPLAGKT